MHSDQNPLEVSPEFIQLSEECELLKGELSALFAEWEFITKHLIPVLEADYIVKIGTLQWELLQIKIRIRRTKRKIEILQAAKNRGEEIDDLLIEHQLDKEFYEWKAKLDAQLKEIKDAENTLSNLLSEEDSKEMRSIYRSLVKKLHPDVNPDQSEEAKNLWLQVQSAYDMGDLMQLQALHLLAEDIPDNYDLPSSIDLLRERRSRLKSKIIVMLEKIAELKCKPIMDWQDYMNDQEYIENEQRLLKEQIKRAKIQFENVRSIYKQMKNEQLQ